MLSRSLFIGLLVVLSIASKSVLASDKPMQNRIKAVMDDYNQLCQQSQWMIWKESLCGPLLFVEPKSRTVFASHQDVNTVLKANNGIFTGKLPLNVTIANTAIEWSGIRWSMLLLPLPSDIDIRRVLIAHESWHRIQPKLKLLPRAGDNGHLSQLMARYLLLLELRALASSLEQDSVDAIKHALIFRERRYQLYPNAKKNEQRLEINEGLAEYNGYTLNLNEKLESRLISRLRKANRQSSLERSFAYSTGAAYGLLLDRIDRYRNWLKEVRSDFSFSETLKNRINFNEVTDEKRVSTIAANYNGEALWIEEKQRFDEHTFKLKALTDKFIHGSTLTLPLAAMQFSFDPNKVISLAEHGKVYESITLTDAWGRIEVTQGLLITADFKSAIVSIDDKNNGWSLQLAPDWITEPSEKGAIVTRQKAPPHNLS